ncbi:MAG: hypothetical protein H7039_22800, partial [Bryobacteraceae bacterium]|nr:hypothetical protein [Bryobacteraceae bacterium]
MALRCIWVSAILISLLESLVAQTPSQEEFKVYTEHPRLLLTSKRLRLLRRERERQSLRWIQFDTLMRGRAAMPEQPFSSALYSQVTEDATPCRNAAAAVRPATDLRQVALVFDWCQGSLEEPLIQQLKLRLERSLKERPSGSFASARDRTFAALVLNDSPALNQIVNVWWRANVAKALREGSREITHADLYPFTEMIHAIRDNLQVEMREDILPVFKTLAHARLLSYYPASFPAAENEYRIPYFTGKGEPDLRLAALNRAAEFALVSYESNAQEMQFLQGWLLLDRFVLKNAFGAPYEFLWANPYQPGLPFQKTPLLLHEERSGTLFARSSWEEDAEWLGVFGGLGQLFRDGQVQPAPLLKPLEIGSAMILSGSRTEREFQVPDSTPDHWFLLGLT